MRLITQRCDETTAGQVGDQAGLRQDGDIRRTARFGIDHDLLLVVLGGGIFHGRAGRILEIGDDILDQGLIIAAPRTEHRHGLAGQVIGFTECRQAVPVEVTLTGGECQVPFGGCDPRGQHRHGGAGQQIFHLSSQ